MAYESTTKAIKVINDAYKCSLSSGAPESEQPTAIKVPLRAHQKSILHAMEQREEKLSRGMDLSGAKVFSRFSFLGDGVGVGKSLMVLGHIARLRNRPALPMIPQLDLNCTSQLYSLQDVNYARDLSDGCCLVVVPHTLYRQWQTYIKDQTTLKCVGIQMKRNLEDTNLIKKIKESDLVLVSNTLYGTLQDHIIKEKIIWKRVFYDEADTLHLPNTRPRPETHFTWLISASWPNLLFPNTAHYFTSQAITAMLNSTLDPLDEALKQQLRISQTAMITGTNATYTYLRYYMISANFFREFVHTANPMRGHLVLRCRDEYVKESITLPPIHIRNILCRPSVLHQVVSNAIPADVSNLLHAGDIQGALQSLGVKTEEPVSIVEAVCENRFKELDRLRKTYEFKASLEYSTTKAKEEALKTLQDRITRLESQIKELKERIENYKTEMCPICFDEPETATLTACCSRIFCGACILTSLTRASTCPLCRAQVQISSLKTVGSKKPIVNNFVDPNKPPEPLKKTEQLLEVIKNTKDGKFLVFSRYDNPFVQISKDIESLNVTVKHVRGNKDVIASTLKSFQTGDTKVLLLNSVQAGAGLNITAATHVILLHAMTHEEEKQILGRAYRLGRTEPLDVIRLLHPDEMLHTHSQ